MKKRRYILILLMAALVSSVALQAKKAQETRDDASLRKARYYYLEGAKKQAANEPASAYELYKHALRINPDYPEAALQVAQIRVALRNDSLRTREELRKSLKMMQSYVDTYPGDFFESQYYGFVATQLDTLAEARRVYARADSLYPEKTVSLLKLAEACMRMRDRQGTFDALDKYQSREGRSDHLSQLRVFYSSLFGDSIGALEEATANVREFPQSASAQLLRGRVFESLDRPDSARLCYERAEALDPDDGAVKFEVGRFFLSLGDTATFEQKIYEGLMSEELEAAEKIEMLTEFLKNVNVNSADTVRVDRLFGVMTGQYPHEPELRRLSAVYNFQRKNIPQALEDIEYAIDMNPESEPYYAQKLMMEAYDDKFSDALKTYRRAEEVMTPSWRMMQMAGQCAALVPDSAEAFRISDKMLKFIDNRLNATDTAVNEQVIRHFDSETAEEVSKIYTSLGDMLHNLNHNPEAYKKYEVAIATYPLNPLPLNNYAYFLTLDKGDLEKALELSEKSLDIDPDSPTYLDTFAYILHKLGRNDDALVYQLQAIEGADPESDNAELYDHLGDIYFFVGEKDKALENWKKALKIDPDSKLIKKKIDKKQYFEE